jgi:hypothetical protein
MQQTSLHPATASIDRLLDWLVVNSFLITVFVLTLLALLLMVVALHLFRQGSQLTSIKSSARPGTSRLSKASAKKRESSGWTMVDNSGQIIGLQPLPFTIGREAGNTLVLEDASVAPRHARILYDRTWSALVIEDLDSPEGIQIEGQPTRKNLLHSGMHLTVGRYTFTLSQRTP